jgi:PAS domain S-box-containing protein
MTADDLTTHSEKTETHRANHLFNEQSESVYRNTDRLFAVLLPFQWVAGVISSLTLVSGVWDAVISEADVHVRTAIFLGGIIILPATLLAIFYPGRTFTRYAVATGQILISALLVYAADNRTESYFSLFGSLAFLSFYRDWKLLSFAGFLATLGYHFGSTFSTMTNARSGPDLRSWVEMIAWMIFENIFLISWIRASVKSMRQTAARTAALETKEERYRAVVEQTMESIALIDPDTLHVLECNKAFSILLGYDSVEEIKTRSIRDFSTATDEQLSDLIERIKSGGSLTGERTYRRRDGSHIAIEASGSMIKYGGKSVLCATFKDLRERKVAEVEMRRLALVAQKTQNSVVVCDPDGKIQWVNEGFMRVTGYEMNEVIGRHPINVLCGEDTDRKTLAAILTAVNAQLPFDGEIFNYKKNGDGFWSSISLTPILDDKGVMQGSISIEMDITERKRMETKLRHAYEELEQRVLERTSDLVRANKVMHAEVSERKKAEIEVRNAREFLKKVIDNVPTLIAVRDSEDRFTLANIAFAKMLGTTIEEMIGKTPEDFHHDPEELRRIKEEDDLIFEQWREKPFFEEKYTDTDGEIHFLETIKRPLISDGGEKNILVIANDLTERRVLEGQLRHAQKLESIGQLAAGIAHEINTPTQYVSDNIRFLNDANNDIRTILDKYAELLQAAENGTCEPFMMAELRQEIIETDLEYILREVPIAISQSLDGVSRITKIVQSMKDFAHPGSGEKTAVDLNKAIESTITVARNEWKYVATVETDLDETLPPVPCIIGELNQVFLNMIINAAHAIKDVVGEGLEGKGKITISTKAAKDGWIEVRIADTGAGVPLKVRNRIFDPFFTTKEIGKGSGQGLAISHTVVVDKHGGKLTFETEEGKGTTFLIRLPGGPYHDAPLSTI